MIDGSHKGGFVPLVHCASNRLGFLESIYLIHEIDYELYFPLNLGVGACGNLSELA